MMLMPPFASRLIEYRRRLAAPYGSRLLRLADCVTVAHEPWRRITERA